MAGVIQKSMMLLTLIGPKEEKEDWSTTEISRQLQIPVQTVHRLLNCLCEVGFVVQDMETRRFRLGTRLIELGLSIRESKLVRSTALPLLIKLSKEAEESVYLSVMESTEGVIIDCVNSIAPIYNFNTDVKGIRLPLSVDAANKVILANLGINTRDKVITELVEKNIVEDRNDLESELRVIKQYGFSLTYGEKIKGATSIAVPIFSWEDKVIASISLSINTENENHRLNKLIDLLLTYSKTISKELGWIG
ncbi:IclR family transcriptional regulator [Bacillus sp. AFS040349]|uniref:IclR family transcriptional regulator n=1 Tax=Bacillus sp. AFS040349 TaxID=2033502 RepID=UPI000BFDE0AA|nr:IclR family transcriptional regulator [Bacillus sp. AFS040349]PGT76719.1 transcriptional regulator, IclR family protein [Bacillus sp. AFS040349]